MGEWSFELVLIACFAGATALHVWKFSGGETVGVAHGVAQGQNAVPGMTVRAVVKRHMARGILDRAELQLRIHFNVQSYPLQPGEAEVLARALEEAVAQVRKDS